MSRHAELHGADAEPLSVYDSCCDYCGRTIYGELLRQVTIGHSTSMLCSACYGRQQAQYAVMTGTEEQVS